MIIQDNHPIRGLIVMFPAEPRIGSENCPIVGLTPARLVRIQSSEITSGIQ